MNSLGEAVGTLDLKSSFGSSLDVYNETGMIAYSGKFRFFSSKWEIADPGGELIGVLRVRISFFTKRFEYDAGSRGLFEITSPAFSKEYHIMDDGGQPIASFVRTSKWMQSGAFQLQNSSAVLDSYELVAVVMGVHAIQKRQSAAAASN